MGGGGVPVWTTWLVKMQGTSALSPSHPPGLPQVGMRWRAMTMAPTGRGPLPWPLILPYLQASVAEKGDLWGSTVPMASRDLEAKPHCL